MQCDQDLRPGIETILVVACCLAHNDFISQHPDAGESEALAWVDANCHQYLGRACTWVKANGRQSD
jgi:hypothetical protein